jgi:hypothetical protein
VYIIHDKNRLILKNNYNATIQVSQPGTDYSMAYDAMKIVQKSDWVRISIDGTPYTYHLSDAEKMEVKFLFKSY